MDIFYPVQLLADWLVYSLLKIASDSYFGSALNFFVYDLIKIGILLVLINYIMAALRYYLPVDKVKDILTKRRWYGLDYLLAALLGVITPFCSCSSIPLFIGFLSAGIPLGVIFTFLISSPLVNESSLYIFPAIFGFRVTLLYNLLGILISILGGVLIQKLKMEKYVKPDFLKFKGAQQKAAKAESKKLAFSKLIKTCHREAMTITKQVFPYVVLGVGLGAAIHGLVPEALVVKYLSGRGFWNIPLAVLLGAPLYANSVGVVPIAEALVSKGIPLGSVLAFMTATVTISIPEGLMLSKLMGRKLLFTFFGITLVGIILIGYIFNSIYM